jgi:NAD(P)-dependent dehydrogenase (short-subunit alcohol dehydrogenase family)
VESANLPDGVHRFRCDHTQDAATAVLFERIAETGDGLDILVNCAWGGYEQMIEAGQFTWNSPFWQQPMHRWSSMMEAGVRAAFVASSNAARLMLPRRRGPIVNISFWAAKAHIGNAIYGISKAATDKMSSDMAVELREHSIAVVSLYPGLVRTEAVMDAVRNGWLDISNSESPEFIGRVVAALATDPQLMDRSGSVIVAAQLAKEFRVIDIDGRQPEPLTVETA